MVKFTWIAKKAILYRAISIIVIIFMTMFYFRFIDSKSDSNFYRSVKMAIFMETVAILLYITFDYLYFNLSNVKIDHIK